MANDKAVDDAGAQDLRHQIDPHFLFNALNAVASLISEDPAKAEQLVLRMATFYRKLLTQDLSHNVTLDDELELLDVYLDIEEVRFEDRLVVDFDIADNSRRACLPSFLLQTILKNSVKGGLRSSGPPTRILVSAERIGNRVRLVVDDDGCASPSATGQTAAVLELAKARLQHSFPNDFLLRAGPKDMGGYAVEIEIPYVEEAGPHIVS